MSGGARLALDSWEALLSAHRELFRNFAGEEGLWDEVSMKEYDVLYTLAKADGPLRLCDLAEGVLLSQPALSRMVDRLIDQDLVLRASDPSDGRAVRLSLTEQGAELQKKIGWGHGKSIYRELSGRISEGDQRELLRICGALLGKDSSVEAGESK